MQNFRDYYQVLGIAQTAATDEIKTAYRRAARRYHPDLNPNDPSAEERFKAVGEAYEILSDGDRRSEYDQFTQFLSQKKSGGLFNPLKRGGKDYSQFTDFNQFVDYLLSRTPSVSPSPAAPFTPSTRPFRAPSPTPSPSPRSSPPASSTPTPTRSVTPSAPRSSYSVPRASSFSPTPASVASSPNPSPSPSPSASPRPTPTMPPSTSTYRQSTPPRSTPRTVGQNGERGIKNEERSTKHEDRKMPQRSNAPTLQRKGMTEVQLNIALDKAYKGGRERIRLADGRSLTVTLPPAMRSGQTIRVTAHEPSQDQLSLLIKVLHHEVFTLKLPDIYCQIPITPSEAVLGGGIDVLTLDGPVKMVLPAGVHSGQKLKLIGKGYPVEGKRGDQIVELQVQIPTSITAQEQELYEKLRRIESFRPRSNLAL